MMLFCRAPRALPLPWWDDQTLVVVNGLAPFTLAHPCHTIDRPKEAASFGGSLCWVSNLHPGQSRRRSPWQLPDSPPPPAAPNSTSSRLLVQRRASLKRDAGGIGHVQRRSAHGTREQVVMSKERPLSSAASSPGQSVLPKQQAVCWIRPGRRGLERPICHKH
jgi:hypothetical protein